jgi:hypothetical protein
MMVYISGAQQWNAEDRQASLVLTNSDARLLNGLDEIAAKLQALREDNSDSERDAYLAEIQRMARDMATTINEGWL